MRYPERLLKLVRALAVLPGVGPKTAKKLAELERILADAGFEAGGQNIHYLEKRLAEQKGRRLDVG